MKEKMRYNCEGKLRGYPQLKPVIDRNQTFNYLCQFRYGNSPIFRSEATFALINKKCIFVAIPSTYFTTITGFNLGYTTQKSEHAFLII